MSMNITDENIKKNNAIKQPIQRLYAN